jgi:monovalent cation/proton antiporter MnhG/PhaG subunit
VSNLAVDLLLAVGVSAELICCLGVVVMRTTADRLHYVSAGYTVGPFFVLAAVLVREQLSQIGLDSLAAVLLLFLLGPVVTHATARTIRLKDVGQVEATEEEKR